MAIVLVVILVASGSGGKSEPTRRSAGEAPAQPAAPATRWVLRAEDWARAVGFAERAKALADEADRARERGDESARIRMRKEALALYDQALETWRQMRDPLPEEEQKKYSAYEAQAHRWMLAKRKLL